MQVSSAILVVLASMAAARPQSQEVQHYPTQLLDIETPNQFNYNSPLQQPDSLRSKPYFDFLSTLYAHDSAKSNLFRTRPRRDAESHKLDRPRRAIVFRPLFVYKQQEVRKQEIRDRKDAERRHDLQYVHRQ
ncbi:hypothetical protein KR009_000129, partial [Drosophila setifemur]